MDASQGSQVSLSSPLSSLASSPEPAVERHPSKRPRLSTSPSSAPPLYFAQYRSQPAAQDPQQQPSEDVSTLLDGLDEQVFDLPPSSDPVMRGEDISSETVRDTFRSRINEVGGRLERARRASKEDDSGIGLLPSQEEKDDDDNPREGTVEPPDRTEENIEEDYEGDDMWLGFDDADMGFDEPDTFSSSVSSLKPPRTDVLAQPIHSDENVIQSGQDAFAENSHKPPDLESFGFANISSAAGGFVFATRKSFAPSLAALKRAQALFEEDGDQGIEEDSAFARVSESAALPKLPRSARLSPPPARADSSQTDSIQYPRSDVAPSTFGGFQDARGRSLAMPSEEAIRKARQHFDKSSSPDLSVTSPPRVTLKQQSRASSPEGKDHTSFFSQVAQDPQTFSLRPLIPTSQEDRADVSDSPTVSRTRSFVLSHTDTSEISIRHAARSTSPAQQEQPAVLPVESDDVGSEVGSLTETLVSSSPRQRDASPGIDPSSRPEHTATTIIQPSANPMLKHLIGGTLLPPRAAPFRSPMLNSARTTARTSISTPLRPSTLTTSSTASYAGVATSAATPLFNRRLNLGMTPRNKPFHLANTQSSASGAKGKGKAFITPFKGGKRPDGLTPMGLKSQLGSIVTSSTRKPTLTTVPRAAHAAAAREGRKSAAKVFELDGHAEPRLSLVDFDMRPQIHLYEELESIGFSPELLAMNSSNSLTFTFSCGRSVSDAFVELKGLVAARSPGEEGLVARPWVENHWCLIVWKLASYVRSRPDLLAQWWTFDVVMNQLRYRYEREINRAQRSAIKRIQERDSSAAFPMILCVTQLMWDDPAEDAAETECFQIISGLELTDGWYRIQAKIDSTLQSACERGKLIVGSKIAITGARLENLRGDGIDVLEAVNRSKLVLSGNSTSLAPWHAKLGFSPIQFCASLASLSSAGGSVAPLDIIIVRLFELGFVDAARSNTGTWNKEEEALKAEEWERGRKRIHDRMADAAEKDSSEDDGLVALLREAVQSACEGESLARLQEEDDDPEEILEGLETAADPRAVLRNMPLQTIQACLALAVERADQARKQAYQELKNELDRKCPPRQIRSVRMMRVRDAREGINGRCEREAILTVWDVQSYAADFFREGQRYRVTNTIAKGSWQRSHREISLHTKKDSKWIRVEHV